MRRIGWRDKGNPYHMKKCVTGVVLTLIISKVFDWEKKSVMVIIECDVFFSLAFLQNLLYGCIYRLDLGCVQKCMYIVLWSVSYYCQNLTKTEICQTVQCQLPYKFIPQFFGCDFQVDRGMVMGVFLHWLVLNTQKVRVWKNWTHMQDRHLLCRYRKME